MSGVVGVIPAGGSGERLGHELPKAFVVLGGKRLLDYSLEALSPVCERVVVAVPPGQELAGAVEGGASRSASVRNAVAAAPDADVYVVHDAARPLVTEELVRRCLEGLDGYDGAVAAAPVTDTVKQAGADLVVERTLDRSTLWAIQTPQAFQGEVLRRALDVGEDELAAATDDASLVEAAGGSVRVVEAPPENIKVTSPTDLRVAEALLRC